MCWSNNMLACQNFGLATLCNYCIHQHPKFMIASFHVVQRAKLQRFFESASIKIINFYLKEWDCHNN